MKYCRIRLADTNYSTLKDTVFFITPPIEKLQAIFKEYCKHKQFGSVMPIFDSQFRDSNNIIIGYYDDDDRHQLSAFSILREYDNKNVEALQFAWDYKKPDQRLGIRSLEHECALYKSKGFDYLYLGLADDYKRQFAGYEELGPLV